MNWYNGYSPGERRAKGRARSKALKLGTLSIGACAMCADMQAKRWLHSEDYAKPYLWNEPAVYVLCDRCHRRLHSRFGNVQAWKAYWAFLRQGWFGREVEHYHLRDYSKANALPPKKRNNPRTGGDRWWEQLTLDPQCCEEGWSRPR